MPVWMWIIGALMLARSVVGVVSVFDGAGSDAHTVSPSSSPSAVSTHATVH